MQCCPICESDKCRCEPESLGDGKDSKPFQAGSTPDSGAKCYHCGHEEFREKMGGWLCNKLRSSRFYSRGTLPREPEQLELFGKDAG